MGVTQDVNKGTQILLRYRTARPTDLYRYKTDLATIRVTVKETTL